jgi:predicted alpha-1,2-mannosidase
MKKNCNIIKYMTGILFFITISCVATKEKDHTQFVNRFIGTGGNGGIVPVAAMPFGMVQLGPDTRTCASGYHYDDENLLGFSHIHKSGAGCSDFLDILFLPLDINTQTETIENLYRSQFETPLSHENEYSTPGYYKLGLYDNRVNVELGATLRCGFQRYNYSVEGKKSVLIDLEHGSDCGCSIVKEQDVDTILMSSFELVDDNTIKGSRISSGFAPEQHVYFYTTFSQPIKKCDLYIDNQKADGISSAEGLNIKAIITFEDNVKNLDVKTGISAVDVEGARKNLMTEVIEKSFEEIKQESQDKWESVLGQIEVETKDMKKKELFYTGLFNVMLYPTLSSDVDMRYRGPDKKIHETNGYSYYGAVMGFWDTFRAAVPLQSILQPQIMEDYVKTSLDTKKFPVLMEHMVFFTGSKNDVFDQLIVPEYIIGIKDGKQGFYTSFNMNNLFEIYWDTKCMIGVVKATKEIGVQIVVSHPDLPQEKSQFIPLDKLLLDNRVRWGKGDTSTFLNVN